jgi:hypothetical protein
MKKISWLLYLTVVALAALLTGCGEDEQKPAGNGNIRFTVQAHADGAAANGRTATILPAGASVYVTVADASGADVYTLAEITLVKLGGEYISEPLALPAGSYTLTEFLVADSTGTAVYAAPKQGSPLATWVDAPLPLSFQVGANAITATSVEVISTTAHTPTDFGYASFGVIVRPAPYFALTVFKPDSSGFTWSDGNAYVLDSADTIYSQTLAQGTNNIGFVGDANKTYTLVVVENGFRKYSRTFILADLLTELNGAPLSVTLQPALTMVTQGQYLNEVNGFGFLIRGSFSNLTIDWGDGTVEAIDETFENDGHIYANRNDHFISVYGDLEHVTQLYLVYGGSPISALNVEHLPALQQLELGLDRTPTHLDLTHNTQLTYVQVANTQVRAMDLPLTPTLRSVNISDVDNFSATSLNNIIHTLYTATVNYNPSGGSLFIGEYDDETDTFSFITQPSPQALDELRVLRDQYNWFILPGNF